jgi:hypothetical protein
MPAAPLAQSDSSDTEAMAAKRARVEAPKAFADIDLEGVGIKAVKNRDSNAMTLFVNIVGEPIFHFNLTPQQGVPLIYGFDTSCKYEQPSFLTGKEGGKSNEGLTIRIGVDGARREFLQKLDEKLQEEMAKIDPSAAWQPLIMHNERHGNDSVKLRVFLKGDQCAAIKVWGEEIVSGTGWPFLEPLLNKHNGFRQADAKLVVRVSRVWHFEGKAGVTLDATQLALKPAEKQAAEFAFPDDTEW